MKYVIFETYGCLKYPVLFSEHLEHSAIATFIGNKAISAGFIKIYDGEIRCFGRSSSLNLTCQIGDEEVIKRNLRDHSI